VQIKSWWRVRGGYTFMDKRIRSTDPAVLPASGSVEGNDPHNQVLLQSMMDLPENFQLDLTARYVDSLPDPGVPSYFSLDARLAWHYRNVEVAIVGQNLLDDQHPEFGTIEIPRSIYGSLTVRW
jgi:iron complex outermembrane receptor protein